MTHTVPELSFKVLEEIAQVVEFLNLATIDYGTSSASPSLVFRV